MDSITNHDKRVAAAVEVARFLEAQKPVKAVADRIKAVRPHLEASVQEICKVNGCTSFSDEQIEILSALTMHIVVINDPSLQDKPSFWGDFGKLSPLRKLANIGVIITIIVGIVTMFGQLGKGVTWATQALPINAEKL